MKLKCGAAERIVTPALGLNIPQCMSFNPATGGAYEVKPVLGGRESRNAARSWKVPPNAPIGYLPLKVEPPPPWKKVFP